MAAAILDLFVAYFDHLRMIRGGLYHCTKFGCNRCSSFENMKVRIFRTFGLKTPNSHPQNRGYGEFDHLSGQQYQHMQPVSVSVTPSVCLFVFTLFWGRVKTFSSQTRKIARRAGGVARPMPEAAKPSACGRGNTVTW